MHPMMIMAMAGEVARERRHDRHRAELRSLALANRAQGVDGAHVTSRFLRRLLAGVDLRPRLS